MRLLRGGACPTGAWGLYLVSPRVSVHAPPRSWGPTDVPPYCPVPGHVLPCLHGPLFPTAWHSWADPAPWHPAPNTGHGGQTGRKAMPTTSRSPPPWVRAPPPVQAAGSPLLPGCSCEGGAGLCLVPGVGVWGLVTTSTALSWVISSCLSRRVESTAGPVGRASSPVWPRAQALSPHADR